MHWVGQRHAGPPGAALPLRASGSECYMYAVDQMIVLDTGCNHYLNSFGLIEMNPS